MRKRFEKPKPFEPDAASGLMEELDRVGLPQSDVAAELQAASEALRHELELPLHTPLVAGTAEEGDDVYVGASAPRARIVASGCCSCCRRRRRRRRRRP